MVLFAPLLVVAAQAAVARPVVAANPCVAAAGGDARALVLRPVDRAALQPEFFTFRARLQAALARRDEAAVLAVVDPAVRTSFGGDDGVETFRAELRNPQGSLWSDLAMALALGGTFQSPRSFAAPYVSAAWPEEFDSFECAAVIGERVRVRATEAPDSAVVASVSYDIVQRLPASSAGAPVHVRLANGVTGFIAAQFVRSPLDRRAIFERTDGVWRLRAFVAGD